MNNNHHYRFLIITVFLIFTVLISLLIYTKVANSPIITGNSLTRVSPTPVPNMPISGYFKIKNTDNTVRHPVTDYLKLDILADSNHVDVVGYDLILKFDSQSFEVIQVDSTLPEFSIFKMTGENKLTVTGTKKLDAKGNSIFLNNKIMTLILKPKKTGKFAFQLLSDLGKEKSQLVDTMSKIYYPKVNNIEIEIY